MADMGDYIFSSFLLGAILFFGCNVVTDSLTTTVLRERMKSSMPTLVSLMIMCGFIVIASMFTISLNAALTYEPPPPRNLLFWGLDKNADCDYNKVNEFIKVTNSNVVLFGKAKSNAPPVDSVVGKTPNHMSDYESIRTWYGFNNDYDWKAVLVFGLELKTTKNIGVYAEFNNSTIQYARYYLSGSDRVNWAVDLRGEVCNFKTKNSTKTSGWRPLPEASNTFQGL